MLFLLFLIPVLLSAQSTIESVPNEKLINGSYVSNPDNILDDATVSQIDTLLTSLEKKTTVQVAVVALASIGQHDVFEFAQKLFTTWKIGSKGNDNGLLLLLVKDQRIVRLHTGYGLEGTLPDVTCKRIEREFMVPEFKNGNYNAGILAGLQQVNEILSDPDQVEEVRAPEEVEISEWASFMITIGIVLGPVLLITLVVRSVNRRFADSENPEYTPYPEMRQTRGIWLVEYVAIPALIITVFGISKNEHAGVWCTVSLYLYFIGTRIQRVARMKKVINRFLKEENYYEIIEFIRKQQWYWLIMGLLFPLPLLIYFFYHLSRKRFYRNHPRACKACKSEMRKLSEKDEDEYLSKEMQMEETLKAVNYDVWKCTTCDGLDMSFYLNKHSKYASCPKCKTIAYYSTGRRTVKSATYTSGGMGEETHSCKFCGYSKNTSYTIDKLTRSTSSSSSGSSFGSSSSSSGGSWGGGSSGGGGASSSW